MEIIPKLEIIKSLNIIQIINDLLNSNLSEIALFNLSDILNSLGNCLTESQLYFKDNKDNKLQNSDDIYVRIVNNINVNIIMFRSIL